MIFKKEESIKKEDSYKKEKVQRNFNFKNSDKKEEKRVEEKEVKKETRPIISTGAPTSFESARLESAQCL